jgi:hypothetical protein
MKLRVISEKGSPSAGLRAAAAVALPAGRPPTSTKARDSDLPGQDLALLDQVISGPSAQDERLPASEKEAGHA